MPVDSPDVLPGQTNPAEFAHVVNERGATLVVLSAAPDHEHWAKGAPSLASKESPVVARREVDQSLLPKAMTRLTGRSMRLVGASGEVCRGTLAEPFLLSRVEPHFGERQRWDGEEQEDGSKTPALSDEHVAQIAWDLAGDGKLLVAELVETNGDCRDARFARAADLPALSTTAAHRPSASLVAQAMKALSKMPAYEANEKAYRASSQAKPSTSWIESQYGDVSLYEFSMGKATYVWMSASAGEVCSDFSAQMKVLWKVSGTNAKKLGFGAKGANGDPKPQMLELEFEVLYEGEAEFTPEMLVQLPGDAAPSLLGRESLLRKDTKVYEVEELHVPFLDCPC